MTHRLVILASCGMLCACATAPPETRNGPLHESVNLDIVPWRWADYSNRVWISVAGVGVEEPRKEDSRLKKVSFSYSPNTGKSAAEAIAISSFNMFSGHRAEQLLLKVLFGMEDTWLSHSNLLSDGKAFHVYRFRTRAGTTNTAYFDGTMYHNLF